MSSPDTTREYGENEKEGIPETVVDCETCGGIGYLEVLGDGDNFEVDVIATKPCPDCRD